MEIQIIKQYSENNVQKSQKQIGDNQRIYLFLYIFPGSIPAGTIGKKATHKEEERNVVSKNKFIQPPPPTRKNDLYI